LRRPTDALSNPQIRSFAENQRKLRALGRELRHHAGRMDLSPEPKTVALRVPSDACVRLFEMPFGVSKIVAPSLGSAANVHETHIQRSRLRGLRPSIGNDVSQTMTPRNMADYERSG
jgi:hypothetical protein